LGRAVRIFLNVPQDKQQGSQLTWKLFTYEAVLSAPLLIWQQLSDGKVTIMAGSQPKASAINLLYRGNGRKGHFSLLVENELNKLLRPETVKQLFMTQSLAAVTEHQVPADGSCFYHALSFATDRLVTELKELEMDLARQLKYKAWTLDEEASWCMLLEDALPPPPNPDDWLPSVLFRGDSSSLTTPVSRTLVQQPNLYRLEFDENQAMHQALKFSSNHGYSFWDRERKGLPSLDVTIHGQDVAFLSFIFF
jgi:hypothetical protein